MRISYSTLLTKIIGYDPDRHRLNHLLKVWGYTSLIGEKEGLNEEDLNQLQAAALLHDIGIKAAMEKYGSGAGEYQQIEGPPIARGILEDLECSESVKDRVCYLIAHHHQYNDIDGLDYQILVEADFLVNCEEGGYTPEQVASIRQRIFKTKSGSHLMGLLFGLD